MSRWALAFYGHLSDEEEIYDRFFGLNDEYIKSVYSSFFYLKYYGNFSLFEVYNLPIKIRQYYVLMLTKELEKEQEAMKKAQSKAKK